MKIFNKLLKNNGVSPVIGVILLVAVTVSLVALATLIVFDTGGKISEPSYSTTLDINEKSDSIEIQVLRNNNIDGLRVIYPDGSKDDFDGSVGSSTSLPIKDSGTYSIVSISENNRETIRTITVSESDISNSATLTGVISINPNIPDATVEAYDSNNNIIESDITDSNGVYELNVDSDNVDRLVATSEGDVTLNGEPVYAGAEITNINSETINFNFDENNVTSGITVDGVSITVANTLEGSSEPTVIPVSNIGQLQAVTENMAGDYEIIRNIDASQTKQWNNGDGFEPIGKLGSDTGFKGSISGNGYTIDNLYINRPTEDSIGLIGFLSDSSSIKNIGVTNINITGNQYVGGLVGHNRGDSIIEGSYSTGTVNGSQNVGGLIGINVNMFGKINVIDTYSTADVSGDSMVGGLIGIHDGGGGSADTIVSSSYSTGSVTGNTNMGGLVGYNNMGTIQKSYWDINSSGLSTSSGGIGLSTDKMQGSKSETNMNGLDFTGVWNTVADDYPVLQWQD